MPYQCENCGAVFPDEYVHTWGTTQESDGMGNRPMCNKLIPNPSAPPAFRNAGTNAAEMTDEMPMQMCRGELERAPVGVEVDSANRRLTPIKPGRRA